MKTNEDYLYSESSPANSGLKIGEVSRISGIGIEALRFYERSGLLQKPLRSSGGYRIYDGGILQRLDFIKKAQTLGFSLDEIRRIINDAQSGASPCSEVRKIVGQRLAELDERMREMKRYRKELAATLDEWNKIGRAPGNICGLIEASDIEKPASIKTEIAPKRKFQRKKS
jgi:MerR family transcriptional regulator, copper efflux regulator